jgi:hypothetical protein
MHRLAGKAAEAAWRRKGGATRTMVGACALSAAHDLLMAHHHHSHDAHFPLYFWPREMRHAIFLLVKVAARGKAVLGVLDLRDDKTLPSPVV